MYQIFWCDGRPPQTFARPQDVAAAVHAACPGVDLHYQPRAPEGRKFKTVVCTQNLTLSEEEFKAAVADALKWGPAGPPFEGVALVVSDEPLPPLDPLGANSDLADAIELVESDEPLPPLSP